MDLAHTPSPAVDTDAHPVVLVPVGSLEQHGPHAPLSTDLTIARAISERAHAQHDAVAMTPAVPIGISAEHRRFPGSLWVDPDAFRAYVRGIGASIDAQGFAGLVFVNGHGGNVAALEEVATGLTRNGSIRAVTFTWFETLADPPAPMGHGGLLETAAMLAIEPDTIERDKLEEAAVEGADRWGTWVDGTNLAEGVHEFSENGVVGDPREATAEIGDALLEEATENLLAVIDALRP